MTTEQIAAAYEQEYGCKPSAAAVQIAARSYELGRQVADRGYQDQQAGREPLPFSVFESATKELAIAKLLHENYMIGYTGEKEATE